MLTEYTAYLFHNYTAYPVYMVDGTGAVVTLPPNIGLSGITDDSIFPAYLGNIVVERYSVAQDTLNGGAASWTCDSYNVLTRPPQIQQKLLGWECKIPTFNAILFGSFPRADNFAKTGKTLISLMFENELGMRFQNTLNYGIMNCSGKTLFMIDSMAGEISSVAPGNDMPAYLAKPRTSAPMDAQSYIKLFKYSHDLYDSGNHGSLYYGEMVHEWPTARQDGDQFMFLDDAGIALFDNYQKALEFKQKYPTVDSYRREKLVEELEDDLEEWRLENVEALKAWQTKLLQFTSIVITVNVGSVVGHYIVDNWLKRMRNPLDSGPAPSPKSPKKRTGVNTKQIANAIKTVSKLARRR